MLPAHVKASIAVLLVALTGHAQSSAASPAAQIPQGESTSELQPYPHDPNTALATQINTLLADPGVAGAHWGIAVTALDGTPIYGLDEAKLFRPASTAKLFTTAAAMALLGPDKRFTTDVFGNLNLKTGTVNGDLVIIGAGDANFGTSDLTHNSTPQTTTSPDLQDIATQLRAKGVHSIYGQILGDDTLFDREPPPGGWAAEDLVWGYGALPSALSFADNQLRLTVRPQPSSTQAGKPRQPAIVQVDQLVPHLHILNNTAVEDPEPNEPDFINVQPVPAQPNTLNVLGTIAPNATPVVEHVAIPDPAQYAAEALRATIIQGGIKVTGKASALHYTNAIVHPFLGSLHAPPDCATGFLEGGRVCTVNCAILPQTGQLLARHTSAPLAEDVVFTLKTSANLHAELLLHLLAENTICGSISTLDGARILRAWLHKAGLTDADITLYDGSGLSTKDLVTPRAEAQLLAYASTQPWFPAWKPALPVAGVDGTLAARFTNSSLKGKVFAKTGTLGETRALAGYVQCASGHEVAFSILVDNHEPGTSADRSTMDKIVEAIAATN